MQRTSRGRGGSAPWQEPGLFLGQAQETVSQARSDISSRREPCGQSSHSKRYEVNVQKTVITNYQKEKFRKQPNFQLHHKE